MLPSTIPHEFKIFAEQDLADTLNQRHRDLENTIRQMGRNQLLNANEPDLIENFIDEFSCNPLAIDFSSITMTERESQRERVDFGRVVYQSGQMYSFHLPVSGDAALLKMVPNPRVMWTTHVTWDGSEIAFHIFATPGDTDALIKQKDSVLAHIRSNLENVNNQVKNFNAVIKAKVPGIVQSRKTEVLKQLDMAASIGVPMKKKENVPKTFTVPSVRRRPTIIERPPSNTTKYQPEPTLHEKTYKEILQLIHDFGVEIERHPSLYRGKDEESLRDHFILILSPHFEGGATGETFNKAGKTDILIRYESSNVFVAECKFWRGKSAYLQAIDQALGYLTWRDSKAAIICFVDNVELQPVFDKIVESTQQHRCYAETLAQSDGRYEYRFHLSDDPTRNVLLTVLCFHFPKT